MPRKSKYFTKCDVTTMILTWTNKENSLKIFEIVQAQQNISPNVSSQLSLNDKTFYKSIFKVSW